MIDIYLNGVIFASLLNIFIMIYYFHKGNTVYRHNKEKVGYKYIWFCGCYEERKLSIIYLIGWFIARCLIRSCCSWIYVYYVLIKWSLKDRNEYKEPYARHLQNKLDTVDLPKKEISRMLYEINGITTNDNLILPIDYYTAHGIRLDTDEYKTAFINKSKGVVEIESITPYSRSVDIKIMQYKIVNNEVYYRIIQHYSYGSSEYIYYIKDGILLEDNLMNELTSTKYNEIINEYKEQLDWELLQHDRLVWYIKSNYDDNFLIELIKEENALKNGIDIIKNKLNEINIEIKETCFGYDFVDIGIKFEVVEKEIEKLNTISLYSFLHSKNIFKNIEFFKKRLNCNS